MFRLFSIIFLFFSTLAVSQVSADELVRQGIAQYENGDYDTAIKTYEKALELEPKSEIINYEIAMTYFAKKDYKNAVKHADKAISKRSKVKLQAYMIKGNALDMMGKTRESIKLFNKVIKKEEPSYLIYYNLAVNHYKIGEFKEAQENAMKGLELNPDHESGHLLLASAEDGLRHKTQTLLAAHYFLFLEPNTSRSITAYKLLLKNFGGNVSKDPDKPNSVNVFLSLGDDDNPFSSTDMMIALLEATASTEENEGKSPEQLFVENTESFFKMVGELKENGKDTTGYDIYIDFLYAVAKSDHMEAYCNYIKQVGNEKSREWLKNNPDKLGAFNEWLKLN